MRYLPLLSAVLFIVTQVSAQVDSLDVPFADSSEAWKTDLPNEAISADELENEIQSQDISGLLQASRDVFTAVAGFHFSAARFRMRGYGSAYYDVMLNGVKMNNPETGWTVWNDWGGLNDITRYQESRSGISACQYRFSGIGGFSNIEMRASQLRKGSRLTYSATNRSYRHRLMFTHSTGLLSNGWAASLSLSSRWADEGYVEGTYYSSMSYFLSLEKKISRKQSLSLVALGAPTVQARAGLSVQEAKNLTGTNYYNPYWGYQNGEKRNARIRNNHKPLIMLSHSFTFNTNTHLNTTAYVQFGHSGQTGLSWYDAKDPRPDYYRYLPSYYKKDNPVYANQLKHLWESDPSVSQINWDQLYFANMKNLYTVNDAEGQTGKTITGNRSKYIIQEYRNDPLWTGINSTINKQLKDNLMLSGGLHLANYTGYHFMLVNDLLGGDFWVDVDQYAEQDFSDQQAAQNDLNITNNVVYTGEKFGYDYEMHLHNGQVFCQAEYHLKRVDLYAAIETDYTRFWRRGNMRNGRFPDNSFGDAPKQEFITYGFKSGAVYKITGRHFLNANTAWMTRPPAMNFAYLSPRTRNDIVQKLEPEQIFSADINYHIRYPRLKARFSFYYTGINQLLWNRSFWHDELRTYVNYNMTNVAHLYTGMELGTEATLFPGLILTTAFATGQYLWNSRPSATITADNTSAILAENRTVYLKNYRLGWTPQTVASIGFKYNSAKFWFAGGSLNYFDDIWLDANPDRRTEEAVSKYVVSDPQWNEILNQTQLPAGYTIDLFAGKSFRLWHKYYLFFTLSISNLLNNTGFVSGGFEQLRYDSSDIDKFPPKYAYMYGTTYYGMIRISF